MSYSIDLRKRVIAHVSCGGSKSEASRLFGVGRPTIYRWLSLSDLTPRPAKTRTGKLDKTKLAAHVREHPDVLLRERAAEFGVTPSGMWRALRRMRIRKKND
jgi:transposase